MATEITSASFDGEVLNSDKPVLLDFWAPWCGPCKMLLPIVEELSTEMADTVKICKCNVDENPDLAEKFNVMSIPTLIIFKGGEMVDTRSGASSKASLKEWIEGNI